MADNHSELADNHSQVAGNPPKWLTIFKVGWHYLHGWPSSELADSQLLLEWLTICKGGWQSVPVWMADNFQICLTLSASPYLSGWQSPSPYLNGWQFPELADSVSQSLFKWPSPYWNDWKSPSPYLNGWQSLKELINRPVLVFNNEFITIEIIRVSLQSHPD